MAKGKYKIAGILVVAVGGEQIKADKNGVFELTEAQAKHLGQVYKVVSEESGKVMGDGRANAGGAVAKSEITKESLMKLTNEDMDDRCKTLGLKLDKDASKGDKAEAIMAFLAKLDKAAEPKKK